MRRLMLAALAACHSPATAPVDATAPIDGLPDAASTPGVYRQGCDGSGGIALDATHFLDLADDDEVLRIYTRDTDVPAPIEQIDLHDLLAPQTGEVDLEDAALRGNRLYLIGSHGRNTDGQLRPDRDRFAAVDLAGTAPGISITWVGSTKKLLADMLVKANWETPDSAVITALDDASQLGKDTVAALAPEQSGTNIEGLAALPDGTLAIGFRNPQPNGAALIVTLTNADATITGATATFGHAILLDLGGLAIRGMTWSATLGKVLVIAGPHDGNGGFQLYAWSGVAVDPPIQIAVLPHDHDRGNPEAVLAYPDSHDFQLLLDRGDAAVGATTCKLAPLADRAFDDLSLVVN